MLISVANDDAAACLFALLDDDDVGWLVAE